MLAANEDRRYSRRVDAINLVEVLHRAASTGITLEKQVLDLARAVIDEHECQPANIYGCGGTRRFEVPSQV
jgi:hypothetical protein